ncbi:hypothetical protein H257_02908 [Aphanomyces astaci]|uniref:Uncharacterized protein n=1 Tax=Aphanomyces astaci TaxID=112090 RepID=W4H185_APHAT|nr:hypothetical protein H257_02908 [Aphanomyces astaci]ETV85019.1 hypothetical protein H257_02908 [Aphanomyces astaci]RHY68988.1 hypothetical protein DYB38_008574 [Aphanomyces astaci]RHY77407.1 hypothetical protein DYB34_003237 [Aphanomyces astaci]RHZ11459.1 hypothetical protein DYB31_004539 [Aphanomyces astaci]RQM21025.1 hypothetical protein B5M09_000212 [Aphanomyces astaci]|eukprot:XP_009825037.1 hypothetical protein H257_02908 [Aphanomyces astaci]
MSSVLNCIVTPRSSNFRCEVASRTFEEGVSTLTVRDQQGQAIHNARNLIRSAHERQTAEVLARLTARRACLLRDLDRTDAQIATKVNKIDAIDQELLALPKIL